MAERAKHKRPARRIATRSDGLSRVQQITASGAGPRIALFTGGGVTRHGFSAPPRLFAIFRWVRVSDQASPSRRRIGRNPKGATVFAMRAAPLPGLPALGEQRLGPCGLRFDLA